MGRLHGVNFRVAAFTNLTQDHLDLHGSMEGYAEAKARLFRDHLVEDGVAVINIDDPYSEVMLRQVRGARVLRVSRHIDADAEVRVTSYSSTIGGIRAQIATPRGTLEVRNTALLGQYNVDNLALAVGIGEALGLSHEVIATGIESMPGVPGRVERVDNDAGLDILVDYAHTPAALQNVLAALRPLSERRLLCVFGCGGDRDPDKRPKMGAAVREAADLAFVTSDNPRTEDPRAIIDMITPAIPDAFFVDPDRRVAIQAAVAEATPGDVVLIAGKGHEDYQILGTEKVHFDDREEAAAAVSLRARYELARIVEACGGECTRRGAEHFDRVVIDGRLAAPGDLYVAIRGERFDGHDFCEQAIQAGATAVVVERGRGPQGDDVTVIEVDDPRAALGAIAREHRRDWPGKLVAVTGSAGKTTTKELLASALGACGRVHSARGSLNNETGVPLTLLGLRPFHDYAVIEMGMRGLGEIEYLCSVAEPEVGVVVNAGTAHIGRLGSREAIAQAKGEIFAGLLPGGVAVFPRDDERLAELARAADAQMSFGEGDADVALRSYQVEGFGSSIEIAVGGETVRCHLPLVGRHNALNACCALAGALALGVERDAAVAGLERTRGPAMRNEILELDGRRLLLDCYNANPASMAAALATLSELRAGGRAVAVIGDMLELGEAASESHREVGQQAASLDIPVVALGDHRREVVAGATERGGIAWSAADPRAAARAALACTQKGDWILLKASRGMKLERVAEAMRDEVQ
jgi:murE/murF fusion protein